jgi:hypothetical protein
MKKYLSSIGPTVLAKKGKNFFVLAQGWQLYPI